MSSIVLKKSNLLIEDMELFIEKYTRFMSKNTYITVKMYDLFLKQYDYLYYILEKEKLLYYNSSNYQKIMNFRKNKDKFVRLHNIKYLKKTIPLYEDFFKDIDPDNNLDITKKNMILCMEEEMLIIQPKLNISFIIGKLKYLIDILKYQREKILIITDNKEKNDILQKEFQLQKIQPVNILEINMFQKQFLKEKELLLDRNRQYEILKDYLINILFPNKKEFTNFYEEFKNYIYLNQEYKDFDTFLDYHHYMYKRKHLSTKLTTKRFNEQEIQKRKNYLRTICNEFTNNKTEVDIANFLYLNNIPYKYYKNNSQFQLYPNEKDLLVFLKNEDNKKEFNSEQEILLYNLVSTEKNILEILIYELIKRRCPMEKKTSDEVFNKLKYTSIDGYFNDFISNYLIPFVDHYQKYHNFTNTKLNNEQIKILIKIIDYYNNYLQEFNLVEESELLKRLEQHLDKNNYKYIIELGEISLKTKSKSLKILEEYPKVPILQENIKLTLEYKKYLTENKKLPILHAYVNKQELQILTNEFLKKNLNTINQELANNPKKISIFTYDDENRLSLLENISKISKNIIESKNEKDLLIGLKKEKDIRLLFGTSDFTKTEKKQVIMSYKKVIPYEELKKINRIYNILFIPYLIEDCYHENLLDKYSEHQIKILLLIALSKTKKELCLLCPNSKKKILLELLMGLKNVEIYS